MQRAVGSLSSITECGDDAVLMALASAAGRERLSISMIVEVLVIAGNNDDDDVAGGLTVDEGGGGAGERKLKI